MTKLHRRLIHALLLFILIAVLIAAAIAWWGAGEIVRPARRQLQDYHLAILNSPFSHGLSITPFKVPPLSPYEHPSPTLLCEPDPKASPGLKGRTLRDQLAAQGIALAPFGHIHATIVLLHGRKGRKEDNLPVAERFCAIGFRCLLIDLPAHGENLNPIASYGLHEWALPDQVATYAAQRFQYPPIPRALWGISQGGAVAVQAAAKTPWNALITVSSYARFEDICQGQARRLFGHASWPMFQLLKPLVEHRGGYRLGDITPIHSASQITIPTFIGHGSEDTLIPIAIGEELYQAIPATQKRWRRIENGTHDRVLVTPLPLYAEMAAFFLDHLSAPPPQVTSSNSSP